MSYGPAYLSFLGLDQPPPPDDARFRVLPIPYDLTTSYQPGARRGPLAILEASTHLEWWDHELRLEPAEAGIATLSPIEPETSGPAAMLDRVLAVARSLIDPDRFLLSLGGGALADRIVGAGSSRAVPRPGVCSKSTPHARPAATSSRAAHTTTPV